MSNNRKCGCGEDAVIYHDHKYQCANCLAEKIMKLEKLVEKRPLSEGLDEKPTKPYLCVSCNKVATIHRDNAWWCDDCLTDPGDTSGSSRQVQQVQQVEPGRRERIATQMLAVIITGVYEHHYYPEDHGACLDASPATAVTLADELIKQLDQ